VRICHRLTDGEREKERERERERESERRASEREREASEKKWNNDNRKGRRGTMRLETGGQERGEKCKREKSSGNDEYAFRDANQYRAHVAFSDRLAG